MLLSGREKKVLKVARVTLGYFLEAKKVRLFGGDFFSFFCLFGWVFCWFVL